MRWVTLLLVLAATASSLFPSQLLAKEAQASPPKKPSAADLDEAVELHTQALQAFRAGEAEEAAALWERAAEGVAAPELVYDRALALDRAGKREEAARVYEQALTGDDGEHARRSLFNLGALELENAWGAKQLLALEDQALLDAVREESGSADGEQLPEQVQQAVQGLRGQIADKGIEAARSSVKRLRDLVRRSPDDREAVQNLELAQRTLRELRAEREKQKQQERQQDERGEPDERDEQNPGQDPQESPESQDEGQEQQSDPQQGDGSQDQQQEQKGASESEPQGQQGEEEQSKPNPQPQPESSEEQETAPKDSGEAEQGEQPEVAPEEAARENAENTLKRLLEAAARRTREVRELQRARARRTPVEKDW